MNKEEIKIQAYAQDKNLYVQMNGHVIRKLVDDYRGKNNLQSEKTVDLFTAIKSLPPEYAAYFVTRYIKPPIKNNENTCRLLNITIHQGKMLYRKGHILLAEEMLRLLKERHTLKHFESHKTIIHTDEEGLRKHIKYIMKHFKEVDSVEVIETSQGVDHYSTNLRLSCSEWIPSD